MGLIEKSKLVRELSPPFDHLLCTQIVDEFISAERRFIQRDWEPAELDGGQFCEIAARIYYHIDSGNLSHTKPFDDCVKYLENDQVPHAISPRHDALHVGRVLRTVYKFRSQRGAVHISPNYGPNHMDARLIVECIRWVMNETLRIFWRGDREQVARAIRELLQFDVPCIGLFEDVILVQRTDLTAEEEILVLLHYAGEIGFSRTEIGKAAKRAPSTVTTTLQNLSSPTVRQIVKIGSGNYRLTGLGSKRIRTSLADKLILE
ncbi:hypothetical protein P3C58_20600 [Mesorhizobium sp. XAP10]|uniref:hypothetical protein n=1 Tax=unclassified Mesorhizobium TaxID=325217 RepID=UPI0023DF526F|nr:MULTISPECIES: hypothetical protein [unclassified Mesorhizobium]MDF3154383.1 hypothetical protein [Mesorhizobium sp. XAP10]MDF3246848.1 hypothetical protein [Mesorhizobium sp. XAP4]